MPLLCEYNIFFLDFDQEVFCDTKENINYLYFNSYTCPDWETIDKTKCHYNGKAYSPGEQAVHAADADSCAPHCTCQEGSE